MFVKYILDRENNSYTFMSDLADCLKTSSSVPMINLSVKSLTRFGLLTSARFINGNDAKRVEVFYEV